MALVKTEPYESNFKLLEDKILERAAEIMQQRYMRRGAIHSPSTATDFLKAKLGAYEKEVFAVLYLDGQNRVIEYEELFFGTINSASVYPREVIKSVLNRNAASIIIAHNHPSGDPTPSQADKLITNKLEKALSLIDVPILDHIVIGESCVSFAHEGLLNIDIVN
ncbi:DNA repair protein RadC [Pseudoalteromonas sp. 68 DY56-GL68]|uniref:RadC family protein n=1 Tax=Pseudoalteromonas sp. 68 DY56-GL68 TaxID=2974919 RepID=UPI00352ADF80